MSTTNRSTVQARDAQVITGIQKHLQQTSSLPLGGSTYTPADLVKLLQSRIDSANTVAAARASWLSTVAAHKTLNAKLAPVLRGLRQYVSNVYGEANPILSDFGFTAPKRATRTPEEKAAAAAKAKATREARHTMGKKQKKGIKGNVSASLVVTPIDASQPTAPPQAGGTTTGTETAPAVAPATTAAAGSAPAPVPASPAPTAKPS